MLAPDKCYCPRFPHCQPHSKRHPKNSIAIRTCYQGGGNLIQLLTKEEEGIIEVSDSKDDFEVFNQLLSPETPSSDLSHPLPVHASHAQGDSLLPEDIGIQRKSR